jgi:glycosyltransferase involved in cell wall biosynthesis
MIKKICILSFSPIRQDARVLRQIRYLSEHYDVAVVGHDKPRESWFESPNITWHLIGPSNARADSHNEARKKRNPRQIVIEKLEGTLLMAFLRPVARKSLLLGYYIKLLLGRVWSSIFESWYWNQPQHVHALEVISRIPCDAIHANDWQALPVAAEAARFHNAKLIFDAHEYAPLEFENRPYWNLIFKPIVSYFIRKYVPQVVASITVATSISERYEQEFSFHPFVILNDSSRVSARRRELDFRHIHLIHHGIAARDRNLEIMIEALSFCDHRYTLNFMLIRNDPDYIDYLNTLARTSVPGRVIFHEPVLPGEIVQRVAEYDIGICVIAPTSYNYRVSLPNKFFDYIIAGLPVCIGPSPSMAEIVYKYGCGIVSPSFSPRDVADTLNNISLDQLKRMQRGSKEAANEINEEKEMSKLLQLYAGLNDQG